MTRRTLYSDAYEYEFFDFKDIYRVTVNENNKEVYETKSGDALTRAVVGGLLFGGVGAIVGGTTANQQTTKKSILDECGLDIYILDRPDPIFSFSIKSKSYTYTKGNNVQVNWPLQRIHSNLIWPYGNDKPMHIYAFRTEKKDLSTYRIIKFLHNISVTSDNLYSHKYNFNIQEIAEQLKTIAIKVEGVIKKGDQLRSSEAKDDNINMSADVQEKSKDISSSLSIADEIKKMIELKESGCITEEEFIAFKKNLLNN